MAEPTIFSPTCNTEIKLTESLAGPLVAETRRALQEQINSKEAEIRKREGEVARQLQSVAREREQVEIQVSQRVTEARKAISSRVLSTRRTAKVAVGLAHQ